MKGGVEDRAQLVGAAFLFRRQHPEGVAAQATKKGAGTQHRRQPLGQCPQQLVPVLVAQRFVDLTKMVDVDLGQNESSASPASTRSFRCSMNATLLGSCSIRSL